MKIETIGGARLIMAPDKKFKNFKMTVSFQTPQGKYNATMNSLLMKVLVSGSARYKTKREISRKLKMMYGTAMYAATLKKASCLSPSITFDAVSDEYTQEGLIEEVFAFANEIIRNPLLQDNTAFLQDITELEKNNLIHDIESMINDKRRYALLRCLEITCGDDPYGCSSLGDIDICRQITAGELYEYYRKMLASSPASIILIGNFDPETARRCAAELLEGTAAGVPAEAKLLPYNNAVEIVSEQADIAQGKLIMAFKTGVGDGPDYYAETLLNGIFGGTVASKLFNVVREQMSLCYYASSVYDKNKGLILAQAGIDFDNYDKTVEAIKQQLSDIQEGKFTPEEMSNTVAALTSSARMSEDNLDELLRFYDSQSDRETILTPGETAEKYSHVTARQIQDLARLAKLETVYFLSGKGQSLEDK